MEPILIQYFNIPLGELIIGTYRDELCLCDWRYRKMRTQIDQRIQDGLNAGYCEGDSETIRTCKSQISSYLEKRTKSFDLPLLLVGSDFQKSVWQELLNIPYGKTTSYLNLARKLNNVKAIRAVASANGANAISLIVPCHRVVGSSGELTGYAGGLRAKRKLLDLESNQGTLFQ